MIQPVHVPPAKLTADDRHALPDDGKRWEILEGELAVSPAPGLRHQRILRELVLRLAPVLDGELLFAPIDVILGPQTVCQPDLVFVSSARAAILEADGIHGAPDLVVEVLSPSTRRTDVVLKSRLYAEAGVGAYWIVDPDLDRIEVYLREGAGWGAPLVAASPGALEPPGLPGLSIGDPAAKPLGRVPKGGSERCRAAAPSIPLREVFGR